MIEASLLVVAVIVLLIASYSDIKTREVPDWLNFSLIATGLGFRAILSVTYGWSFFLSGLIGLAIYFILALLFYYTHQWGGGDSKLLMGIGAVIGVSWPFSSESLSLLWFFIALLFLGAVWGLVWMMWVAFKKWHLFAVCFKSSLRKIKIIHLLTLVITLGFVVLAVFYLSIWPLVLFPPFVFYSMVFITSVEKSCFHIRKKPSEVKEGDWLAENIIVNGRIVITKSAITRKNLTLLSKLGRDEKINSVLIKDGIPFVPGFLLAFLAVNFLGQPISMLLQLLF